MSTPRLGCLPVGCTARPHRFKVRTRHHRNADEAFVEVKTREGGHTVKRRLPHDPRNLLILHPAQHTFVGECLTAGRVMNHQPSWLLPALQTLYSRTTLLTPDGHSRVTVDNRLHWYAMGKGSTDASDLVVVETESPGSAGEIDGLMWSLGHRPTRISKYGTGLAVLRPDLPANRWHRIMGTHFA